MAKELIILDYPDQVKIGTQITFEINKRVSTTIENCLGLS